MLMWVEGASINGRSSYERNGWCVYRTSLDVVRPWKVSDPTGDNLRGRAGAVLTFKTKEAAAEAADARIIRSWAYVRHRSAVMASGGSVPKTGASGRHCSSMLRASFPSLIRSDR